MINEQTLIVTEVRIKGESDRVILPRPEMQRLLDAEQVEAVYKFAPCERAIPEGRPRKRYAIKGKFLVDGRPSAEAIITSATPDRDGDVMNIMGADLDRYIMNPVVLPMHVKTFPIGFAEEMRIYADRLWAQWQWLTDQPDTEAAVYQRLWDAFVLNATSIGLLPRAVREGATGMIYDRWELIEFSPVVIPANAEAMRTNTVRDALDSYGEMVFESDSPVTKGLWMAGEAKGRPKQIAISHLPVGQTGPEVTAKPLPSEHSCRLRDPADFQEDSFRRTSRKHDAKEYDVIMGRLKGETTMTEQAYRYPKDSWRADEAKGHCKDHDGRFEAAGPEKIVEEIVVDNVSTTNDKESAQADVELKTLDEARVAFATGAIDGEGFMFFVEEYVKRITEERDGAVAEVRALRGRAAALAATVVVRR